MTAPGALISGRYRLVRLVAAGGMGSVWEGWDELLQRRVAVKQLLPQPGLSADEAVTARNRVIREARITARLHHPNAVTLYDVVGYDGRPCLIMQFVPSVTLSALVRTEGTVQPQFAARIGAELASALGAAHDVGIIHRDVKPGNVLITDDGSAKLTDFGISHAVGDVTLTSTGMISGTPAFLAPEVARGAASGFAADVFSLGATLYAAMEGGPPSGTDTNPMAVLHRVASGHLIPPERTGPLTPLVLQMLAQDPGDRPTIKQITGELTRLDREFTGGRSATVDQVPATRTVQTVRTPPSADPTAAEVRSALEVPPEVPDQQPRTATQLEPTGRRRRIGALPIAAFAAVLIATIVISVLLVTNRNDNDQAGPPAPSASTTNTSSSRTTAPGSSPPSSSARSSAAPGTSGVALAPAITSSRPSTAGSSTTAPSTTPPSTTPPSSSTTTSTTTTTTPSTSTTSSTTAAPSTSGRSSSAASSPDAGTPSTTELARAVTDYYALLPGDTDAAWERLTPHFQSTIAGSRQRYQRFWNGIERVTLRGAEGSAPATVNAEITYYFKDGRVAVEATQYILERDGDQLDIDTSTVLSSETS